MSRALLLASFEAESHPVKYGTLLSYYTVEQVANMLLAYGESSVSYANDVAEFVLAAEKLRVDGPASVPQQTLQELYGISDDGELGQPCVGYEDKGFGYFVRDIDFLERKEQSKLAFESRASKMEITQKSRRKLQILSLLARVNNVIYSDFRGKFLGIGARREGESTQGLDKNLKELLLGGYVSKPSIGVYQITDKGKEAVRSFSS